MSKILVTGYIGSHTTIELLNAGYEVEIIDNLYNSKATIIDSIEQISGKHPTFYEQALLDKSAPTLIDTSLPSIIFLHY